MNQNYETMYILRSDLMEEQVQQEINKYRDFLSEYKAENIQIKSLGKRRLAYPIKKQQDGFYVQMNYKADGKQVAPMERAMRLSDEVIRYLTIKLKDEGAVTEVSEPAEVSKPVSEVSKPVAEISKPVAEISKPVAEAPKPPVEEPVAEAPKPPVEEPVAEAPKPPVEEPVAEAPKPAVEEPVAEAPKPPVEEPVAEADTDITAEETAEEKTAE